MINKKQIILTSIALLVFLTIILMFYKTYKNEKNLNQKLNDLQIEFCRKDTFIYLYNEEFYNNIEKFHSGSMSQYKLILVFPKSACFSCFEVKLIEFCNLNKKTGIEFLIICNESNYRDLFIFLKSVNSKVNLISDDNLLKNQYIKMIGNEILYIYIHNKMVFPFFNSPFHSIPNLIIDGKI